MDDCSSVSSKILTPEYQLFHQNQHIPNPPPSLPTNVLSNRIRTTSIKLEALKYFNFFEEAKIRYPSFEYQLRPIEINYQANEQEFQVLTDLINSYLAKLDIPEDSNWSYIGDDGAYHPYSDSISRLIEEKYRKIYLILLEGVDYVDYTENIEFNFNNRLYLVNFAKIGGIHCQTVKVKNSRLIGNEPKEISAAIKLGNKEREKNFGNAEESKGDLGFCRDTIRAVRRMEGDSIKNERPAFWFWLHESKQYLPYTADADYLIESFYQKFLSDKDYSLVMIQGSNGKTYMINFQVMRQFNEKTGFRKMIKRVVPEGYNT
jgi:hypothetical protein